MRAAALAAGATAAVGVGFCCQRTADSPPPSAPQQAESQGPEPEPESPEPGPAPEQATAWERQLSHAGLAFGDGDATAAHGGGYIYRLCPANETLTE